MQNFELTLSQVFLTAYLIGLPVNLMVTLFVGYKAGDLKRKYAGTVLCFALTSWVGIAMLCITAFEWVREKREREKRFPNFDTSKNL